MLKIYCPECKWKPKPNSCWYCDPGCHFVWNTFDTFGECPRCKKVWLETECLKCHVMSPHHEWSHDDSDISNLINEIIYSESSDYMESGTTYI